MMIQKNERHTSLWQIQGSALVLFMLIIVFSGCSEGKEPTVGKNVKISKENENVFFLKDILTPYPRSIREHILSDSDNFMELVSKALDLPPEIFVMADKQHFLGKDFKPEDLVPLSGFPELTLGRKNLLLREIVLPDLLKMVRDAGDAGLTLVISSTYRSYDYQKMLFDREAKLYGLKTAERESARPGTSQHQLGVTIDFGSISDEYGETPPGKWLFTNAWKYGFSLSYPEGYEDLTGYRPEIWHYRYITPLGTMIQRKYFDDVQQYMLIFLNENREKLNNFLKRSPQDSQE